MYLQWVAIAPSTLPSILHGYAKQYAMLIFKIKELALHLQLLEMEVDREGLKQMTDQELQHLSQSVLKLHRLLWPSWQSGFDENLGCSRC